MRSHIVNPKSLDIVFEYPRYSDPIDSTLAQKLNLTIYREINSTSGPNSFLMMTRCWILNDPYLMVAPKLPILNLPRMTRKINDSDSGEERRIAWSILCFQLAWCLVSTRDWLHGQSILSFQKNLCRYSPIRIALDVLALSDTESVTSTMRSVLRSVALGMPNLITNNSASGTVAFSAAALDDEIWPSFQLQG